MKLNKDSYFQFFEMNSYYENYLTFLLTICILLLAAPGRTDEIANIIPAIIQVESSGRAWAASRDGCCGLMQISKLAWEDVMDIPYLPNVYNPKLNVIVGERYLRRLKDHYLNEHFTIERLLAAYNMGPTRLKQLNYEWRRIKETKNYVNKIMEIYKGNGLR